MGYLNNANNAWSAFTCRESDVLDSFVIVEADADGAELAFARLKATRDMAVQPLRNPFYSARSCSVSSRFCASRFFLDMNQQHVWQDATP